MLTFLKAKPKDKEQPSPSANSAIIEAIKSKQLQHVGIIMDGNRRWAKHRHQLAIQGHQAGYQALKNLITYCHKTLKLPVLTVYAFSTENWNREASEVTSLMTLARDVFKKEIGELIESNVRIVALGNISLAPADIQTFSQIAVDRSKHNTGLVLQIAFSYGARQEIIEATQSIAEKVKQGVLQPKEITEELFAASLYNSAQYPDPDLIIRTGGEKRLSNFLLWQSAYSELAFTETLWPDFSPAVFDDVLLEFVQRKRRFGR